MDTNNPWGYIGGGGYYEDMMNQQTAQYGGLLGGLAGQNVGLQSYYPQQQMQKVYSNQYHQAITSTNMTAVQSLFQGVAEAPKIVKQKAKRFIERLRAEIDDWHGDVLCREAA